MALGSEHQEAENSICFTHVKINKWMDGPKIELNHIKRVVMNSDDVVV